MSSIYFLRHCQPKSKVKETGYFNGGRTDMPLTEEGLLHAERCAQELKQTGWKFEAIVSSDLIRARQTAEPVSKLFGLPIIEDARLREIDMGVWDGLSDDDVEARWPGEQNNRVRDILNYRIPGGETFREVFDLRLRPAVEEYSARFPGGVLFVCHGGVIRAWLVYNGIVPERIFMPLDVPYGALVDPENFEIRYRDEYPGSDLPDMALDVLKL